MSHPAPPIDLITQAITAARDFSPRETVDLGLVHGLCFDAADAQNLKFFAAARRVAAVARLLSQRPETLRSNDPKHARYGFSSES